MHHHTASSPLRLLLGLTLALGMVTGCAARRPKLPPRLVGELARFESGLRRALAVTDVAGVERLLAGWSSRQAPYAEEGDLYARLLTEAPSVHPGAAWAAVAATMVTRFPRHPGLWRAARVLLAWHLDHSEVEEAVALFPRLDRAPPDVRQKAAWRIAEAWWHAGEPRYFFAWALRAPPGDHDPARGWWWATILARFEHCCLERTWRREFEPLATFATWVDARRRGDREAEMRTAAWLRDFAEEHRLPRSWRVRFAMAASAVSIGPDPEPDRLYVIAPLTGRHAHLGRRFLAPLAACVAPGFTELRFVDSYGNGAVAAAWLTDSARRVWFGPLRTEVLAQAGRAVSRSGGHAVTLNPFAPRSVRDWSALWSAALTPENQARELAAALLRQGWRAMALFAPDDDYGDRFLSTFWTAVTEGGGWFTGIERYRVGSTDYGSVIRHLVGLDRLTPEELEQLGTDPEQESLEPIIDFDVLVAVGTSRQLGLLPPQLAYHDLVEIRVAGDIGWASPLIPRLAREHADAILFVDLRPATETTIYQECAERLGREPELLDALLLEAARLIRSLKATGRAPATFTGLNGEVAVTEEHLLERPLSLWQWRRGRRVPWDGRDPLAGAP